MKTWAYGDEEPSDDRNPLSGWFEQVSANGLQCKVCGSTVQPAGSLQARHVAWHESMDQRPDGV